MSGIKRKLLAEEDRRRRAATLREMAEQGLGIFCWCNRCGHSAVVASTRLVAALGGDCPVPEVGARLRCAGCGGKDVATRPHWPNLGQVARHG